MIRMEQPSMERQPEIQMHTSGEIPKELIYGLLSSLGNGENKCEEIIIMGINRQKVHSRMDLYREVMNHQDPNRRWEMGRDVPFGHCENSFAPISLVAKEVLSDEGGWGYIITQYGIETGIPFAGGLLKWSYEHQNLSLFQMFGPTSSSSSRGEQPIDKKRSPETRYNLLFEIVTNPSNRKREVDLVHGIGEKSKLISHHLMSLEKNKIITYQAVGLGKPIAYYRIKDDAPLDKQPEPTRRIPTLSSHVFEILKENKGNFLSTEQVYDLLIKKYPTYGEREKQSLAGHVNDVLNHLEKQKYTEREKFVGGQFHSEITLSDEQREAITSLVEFLDKFQKGDIQTLREGREFAFMVANNPSVFSSLMLKAKEASPYANAINRETVETDILSILDENSNITTNMITQLLEQKLGKKISSHSVNTHLRRLAQNGTIMVEQTKAGNVYRIGETDNQVVP